MKVLYNQHQLGRILILGISFIVVGVISLLLPINNFLSGLVGIGIMYVIIYFSQKNRAYVIINDEFVQKNNLFSKRKLEVRNIVSVKYFAGDYVIKSKKKELIIDTNLIDKESLQPLKDSIEKLAANL